MVVPIKYRLHGLAESNDLYTWADEVQPYLVKGNVRILDNLVVMAGVNINPTIASPLSAMEALSKGSNLIFGASQLAMKTVAQNHVDQALIISTTGALTIPVYSESKAGCRADFNHNYSAILIEHDTEINDFHYRVLSFDGTFIYDLDKRYCATEVEKVDTIAALVTGDEHVEFISDEVVTATYTGDNCIVSVLKPEVIARHDVLDFYSGSHHHSKSIFTRFAKHHSMKDDVEAELRRTIEFIINTTPSFSKSVIVASNHNDHYLQWLNSLDPKTDHRNAIIYHDMMSLMLRKTKMGLSGCEHPNPLELWANHNYDCSNIEFLSARESYVVNGVELAVHSHIGINGSRGSAEQMAKLADKSIVGHSHSPKIVGACYMVGTSSRLRLEYNGGPSSWANCHVLLYKNGRRTPVFIKQGKWKGN